MLNFTFLDLEQDSFTPAINRLLNTPWTAAYPIPLSMGFSRHGIFQARVLEWVAIAFSSYKLKGLE